MLKQVDLLRHGEPIGGRMYRGQLDHPLSEKGWKEMFHAVEGIGHWDAIFHSPLTRCADFAIELAQRLDVPVFPDDRLKEIGFGVWENRTGEDIRNEDVDAFLRFYRDPVNHQPEGAERLRTFYLRVTQVWEEVIQQTEHENLLFIVHAGVMRAIIAHVLKAPLLSMYRMQIPSAGMITINFGDERPPTLQL